MVLRESAESVLEDEEEEGDVRGTLKAQEGRGSGRGRGRMRRREGLFTTVSW